jgi:DNA-binding XRE family transcriptional regulator
MNLHTTFTEARLRYDTERREQAELARQGLELKMMQHDLAKTIGEIKAALAQLEATKAAPMPPKATTAAPEAKVAVPAPKASPKASPKRPATPLNLAIDNLEHRLAAVSAKIAALAARTK